MQKLCDASLTSSMAGWPHINFLFPPPATRICRRAGSRFHSPCHFGGARNALSHDVETDVNVSTALCDHDTDDAKAL